MHNFVTALIPITTLIILGYILKRAKFLPGETWPGMEKLTYFVLFPSLLIRTLGNQSLEGTPWPSILFTVIGTLMISTTALVLFHKVLSKSEATFTSIFQGGVRFNTYIAFCSCSEFVWCRRSGHGFCYSRFHDRLDQFVVRISVRNMGESIISRNPALHS